MNRHLGNIREIRSYFSGYIDGKDLRVFDIIPPVLCEDENNSVNISASELLLDDFLISLSPDVYHCFSLFEGFDGYNAITGLTMPSNFIKSVTHHDLIPFHNSDLSRLSFRRWYASKIKAIRLSDTIFSVSEYAKNDLIVTGDIPRDKINVAYGSYTLKNNINESEISSLTDAILRRYGISRRFILCSPGGFDDSKNINNLIVAYALLPKSIQELYSLVITSKIDVKKIDLYKNLGYKNNVVGNIVFTNYVTDFELSVLMSVCSLFVVVSIYEGFGLPAVEAMACGAPVITSNTTSLPEITGLEQELFNPKSPADISEKINAALTSETVKIKLKENSRARTDFFSWDKSAKTMINVWKSLHER